MKIHKNSKYQTLEDWEHCLDGSVYSVIAGEHVLKIPTGYTTNGASIPRVFWWVLSPFNPKYIEECTVHDYLCDLEQYKRADIWFNQLLKDNSEVNRLTRKILMFGVKSWHKVAYKEAGYFDRAKPRFLLKRNKQNE